MNADEILKNFNQNRVAYLLIGGMNYLLRHKPVLTFDVDIWIDDTKINRGRCERALAALNAEWGPSETTWGPVSRLAPGWLARQSVFCLTTPHGAIDIFRKVNDPDNWRAACQEGMSMITSSGIKCRGLCDKDMLRCQLALKREDRKPDRIRELKRILRHK